MHRTQALLTATVLGLILTSGPAMSQRKSLKDQLVGAWSLLIADNVLPDGNKPTFGPNPNGIVIFEASGHYALEIARSTNPKIASTNRVQGTADENKAILAGTLAHSGQSSEVSHPKQLLPQLGRNGAKAPSRAGVA